MDDQIIRYRDTRGIDPARPAFSDVVISGIADGGGLYVPEFLPPRFTLPELTALSARSYSERALIVFRRFGLDLPAERLPPLLARAYGTNFDSPAVAPVRDAGDGRWILELWHGPTLAFKDMALQIMPLLFAEAVALKQAAGELEEDFLILVATSGDTGTAALEGFAGVAHTRIAVFYPAAGVSETQRLQMITRPGGNVAVFGVTGTFDDCQNAVKAAFSDPSFTTRLRSAHRLRLSSANSINWGRLLPQIVYYASAYADMAAGGAVAAGAEIDVCVPTGNFGNILAAWYARRLGVPIGRLLCASNENSVLTDFLATGVYELTGRRLVQTPSPSMDILISSNVERLLFDVSGDPERVRRWVTALREDGRFELDRATHEEIAAVIAGDRVTNDDCLAAIGRVYEETGYLMDPHTAVAWEVAGRLRSRRPVLVVSTAHWAKFGADVLRALSGLGYDDPLPVGAEAAEPTGSRILARVQELAPGQAIPPALAGLEDRPVRFPEVIAGSRTAVEEALGTWLSRSGAPDA